MSHCEKTSSGIDIISIIDNCISQGSFKIDLNIANMKVLLFIAGVIGAAFATPGFYGGYGGYGMGMGYGMGGNGMGMGGYGMGAYGMGGYGMGGYGMGGYGSCDKVEIINGN